MLSELVRRHPTRLDLPSESEIRQHTSSLVAKQKKRQSTSYQSSRGIMELYLETALEIFERNKQIAPRIAWQEFVQTHPFVEPLPEGYPDEKKIKSKISSLKAKHKKDDANNNN